MCEPHVPRLNGAEPATQRRLHHFTLRFMESLREASQVALYMDRMDAQIAAVSVDQPMLLLAAGLAGAGAIWITSHYLSREAKLSRRRRRNNARVEPKVNRPMVRLSVRTRRRK